jgi:hypothetical protein
VLEKTHEVGVAAGKLRRQKQNLGLAKGMRVVYAICL